MTEKRFIAINDATTNNWELHDQLLKCTTLSTNAIGITKLLNELSEDNEQSKQFQQEVARVIESKMGDNVCNDYKMEVLKEIWNELNLDEVWFE